MKRKASLIEGVWALPLSRNGAVVLLDQEDLEWAELWNWTLVKGKHSSEGYAYRRTKVDGLQVFLYLHREVAGRMGLVPELVDHRNGRTLDCRRSNLRSATPAQNSRNAKVSARNKSGMSGVYWCKTKSAWVARIHLAGKPIALGYFQNLEEAKKARLEAELRVYEEFAPSLRKP